ncbi:hypothetical protein DFH11DRAFT_1682014 [Phellopilus nigrolimitatus]|nr:hypothetical protein DFH11DRAFT_1682014 [Phellopilus nigrolimitatus]
MPPKKRSSARLAQNGKPKIDTPEQVIAKAVSRQVTFEPTVGSKQTVAARAQRLRQTTQAHAAAARGLGRGAELPASGPNVPLDPNGRRNDDASVAQVLAAGVGDSAEIQEMKKKQREFMGMTRQQKADYRAKRHAESLQAAERGEAHPRRPTPDSRKTEKEKATEQNNEKAEKVCSKPNDFICWEASSGNVACTNDDCQYQNKEITAGHLVMVRHMPGARSGDGFVPDVPKYAHLECVSQQALARLQNPESYHVSDFVDPQQEEQITNAIAAAVQWVAHNPTISQASINAPLAKTKLSKRQLLKLTKAGKKSAAVFHSEHTPLAKHMKHQAEQKAGRAFQKAEKKLTAAVGVAKAEAAKARVELGKEVKEKEKIAEELKEAKEELADAKEMADRLESLISKGAQRNLTKNIKKRLLYDQKVKLHDAAHFSTMQLHAIILRTHNAISQNDGIKKLISDAIDKEHPGEGELYLKKLDYQANKGPHGYLAQGYRGVGNDKFLKAMEDKFSLAQEEVDWENAASGSGLVHNDDEGVADELSDQELEDIFAEAADAGALNVPKSRRA